MAKQKLEIIIRAIKLMNYTMRITSNKKRYPVKYIQLVKRIQTLSMDIYEFLLDANELNADTQKSERMQLQNKAISTCEKLSCFIELSMELERVGSDTVEYWQGLIDDVKYMTVAWRNKSVKR